MLLNVLNSYKQLQKDVIFILAYLLAFEVSQKYHFYKAKKPPAKCEGNRSIFSSHILWSSEYNR